MDEKATNPITTYHNNTLLVFFGGFNERIRFAFSKRLDKKNAINPLKR